MKKYNAQALLDADGWKPKPFGDDMEWSKELNDKTYWCRIMGPSMVTGYHMEIAEVKLINGSPFLTNGGHYHLGYDKDNCLAIFDKINNQTLNT